MKPKQFKCPITWEERRPLIYDRVLFVPHYYDRHHEWVFPGWNSVEIFGRNAPIEVEYCSGNGAWIIEKAQANPDRNWIAVEWQFERVRRIWSKRYNQKVNNLFIVCGDALTFTRYYVPDCSFFSIYINFPDPWPKEKHAKRRLIQNPFIHEMSRTMIPGGIVTFVTDHRGYMTQISQAMITNLDWSPLIKFPYFVTEIAHYGTSYFDTLWRKLGFSIYYLQFSRKRKE